MYNFHISFQAGLPKYTLRNSCKWKTFLHMPIFTACLDYCPPANIFKLFTSHSFFVVETYENKNSCQSSSFLLSVLVFRVQDFDCLHRELFLQGIWVQIYFDNICVHAYSSFAIVCQKLGIQNSSNYFEGAWWNNGWFLCPIRMFGAFFLQSDVSDTFTRSSYNSRNVPAFNCDYKLPWRISSEDYWKSDEGRAVSPKPMP